MGYEAIEIEAKAIVELLEQGEVFYTGKAYNSFKTAVSNLVSRVDQHRDSYLKGEQNERIAEGV